MSYKHGEHKELWSSATFQMGINQSEDSVPQRCLPCAQVIVWIDFALGTLTGLDVYLEASSDGGQNWRQVYDAHKRAMQIQLTASFGGAWHILSSRQNRSRILVPVIPGSLWRLKATVNGGALTSGTLSLRSQMFEKRTWGMGEGYH